jgi:hypothetical protein
MPPVRKAVFQLQVSNHCPAKPGRKPPGLCLNTHPGVPSVLVPYANADENNHAPNENLDLEKFFAGIKCSLSVLDVMGRPIQSLQSV